VNLDELLEPVWREHEVRTKSQWRLVIWMFPFSVVALISGAVASLLLESEFYVRAAATASLIPFIVNAWLFIRVNQKGASYFLRRASELGVSEDVADDWYAQRH